MEKTLDQIKKEKAALKKEKTASRKEARKLLEKRGSPKKCEYCGIDEKDFPKIWGDILRGQARKEVGTRSQR